MVIKKGESVGVNGELRMANGEWRIPNFETIVLRSKF